MTQAESYGVQGVPQPGHTRGDTGGPDSKPGSGGAAAGSGVAPPSVLDVVAQFVPGGSLLSEAVEVDPESLRAAGAGAERIAERLDTQLREDGELLDACAEAHPIWETSSALRRCANAGRDRIRSQSKDITGLADKLKRVGTGYTDAETWAEETLRKVANRLENL